MFTTQLSEWAEDNRRSFPWRETAVLPFRILVAEVLLQRSRGKTVAIVYEELFRRWADAPALSRARVATIASVIRPLGLVKRAETLKVLATEVVRLGAVPKSLEGLLALPGVGRYAASATLAVAFDEHAPVVDGVLRPRLPSLLRARWRQSRLHRRGALGSRRASHPADPRPGVELGGARSGGRGLPTEGTAVFRVPLGGAMCLVTGPRLIVSAASASIRGSDHSGADLPPDAASPGGLSSWHAAPENRSRRGRQVGSSSCSQESVASASASSAPAGARSGRTSGNLPRRPSTRSTATASSSSRTAASTCWPSPCERSVPPTVTSP